MATHKHTFAASEWPFSDPADAMAYSTLNVLVENAPVLLVTHDDDGAWQLLCGITNRTEDGRIVCLGCMFERDPTIGALADLPRGWQAWRSSRASGVILLIAGAWWWAAGIVVGTLFATFYFFSTRTESKYLCPRCNRSWAFFLRARRLGALPSLWEIGADIDPSEVHRAIAFASVRFRSAQPTGSGRDQPSNGGCLGPTAASRHRRLNRSQSQVVASA
jgi:hypothetical protein